MESRVKNGAKKTTHLDQSGVGWGVLLKRVDFKVGGDELILHRQFELAVEVSILPILKQNNEINDDTWLKTDTKWSYCESHKKTKTNYYRIRFKTSIVHYGIFLTLLLLLILTKIGWVCFFKTSYDGVQKTQPGIKLSEFDHYPQVYSSRCTLQ